MTTDQAKYGETIIKMEALREQGKQNEINALVPTILDLQDTIIAESLI